MGSHAMLAMQPGMAIMIITIQCDKKKSSILNFSQLPMEKHGYCPQFGDWAKRFFLKLYFSPCKLHTVMPLSPIY